MRSHPSIQTRTKILKYVLNVIYSIFYRKFSNNKLINKKSDLEVEKKALIALFLPTININKLRGN